MYFTTRWRWTKTSARSTPGGHLSATESKEAIASIRAFSDKVTTDLSIARLRVFESKYYVFCTVLNPREAAKWYGLLDRMYARLLKMFGIKAGTNIWHGKAMVFVFKNRRDFLNYERNVEGYNPGAADGLCHTQGPWVRIAFYRQPKETDFAAVLVPEWINEGLAEWIAQQLVPRSKPGSGWLPTARKAMKEHGNMGGMFENWRGSWQYGAAYDVTRFMIAKNKRGYVRFLEAIKDGTDWRKAMESEYGAPRDRVVAAYGKSIKLKKTLRP